MVLTRHQHLEGWIKLFLVTIKLNVYLYKMLVPHISHFKSLLEKIHFLHIYQ